MRHRLLILFCCLLCLACARRAVHQAGRPADIRWANPATQPDLRPQPVLPPAPAYRPTVAKVYATAEQDYGQALDELQAMLEGDQPLSFKRAVFVTENAYFGNGLDYGAYDRMIGRLAGLARRIGEGTPLDYRYSDSTDIRKNLGIYRLLCDTVPLMLSATDTAWHLPCRYDFEDFAGNSEWSRMFVTKLLATRTGNCHSLPFLYRMLAEELRAPACLSLAPNHIYLQIPNRKNHGWFNTELTSGSFPVDAWLMASGYVTLEAIRNHVYMDTLGLRQSIALCAVDLAKGIERQNSISAEAKTSLMHQCVALALRHFPGCINARLLQTQLLKEDYLRTRDKAVYAKLEKLAAAIHRSGYLQMPAQSYADWLTGSVTSSEQNAPYAKENQRKGAIEGYTKPVLTLGKGRYDEFLQAKPIETVGAVKLDTRTLKLAGFAEAEEQQVSVPADVVSRFLSVDPLAASYPWWTPYQFAGNSPIKFIDLDGLESASHGNDAFQDDDMARQQARRERPFADITPVTPVNGGVNNAPVNFSDPGSVNVFRAKSEQWTFNLDVVKMVTEYVTTAISMVEFPKLSSVTNLFKPAARAKPLLAAPQGAVTKKLVRDAAEHGMESLDDGTRIVDQPLADAAQRTVKFTQGAADDLVIGLKNTHGGNVTVMKDGVDIFRVHQPGSHGSSISTITRIIEHNTPKGPIRRAASEISSFDQGTFDILRQAANGQGGYSLRTLGGR